MAGSTNNIDTGALYFGTANPTLTGQEVDNDSFMVTSDGTPTGTPVSFWKFDEETLTWVTLPSENSNNDRVFYNGANILKNNNVMQAIPALSFNVVPGWYVVKFYPFYNAANTATGAGFNLGSGTAVRTNQTLVAEISNTATAKQQYNYASLAQNYSNTASPRTTDNRAYIEGHFQVTTAGTIIPMFRSENTGLITLRAGTYLTYEKIG